MVVAVEVVAWGTEADCQQPDMRQQGVKWDLGVCLHSLQGSSLSFFGQSLDKVQEDYLMTNCWPSSEGSLCRMQSMQHVGVLSGSSPSLPLITDPRSLQTPAVSCCSCQCYLLLLPRTVPTETAWLSLTFLEKFRQSST